MSSPSARVNRPEALHLQVARSIRNDIDAGALRDGDVLPSTRELAEQWDVSVFTISEAMKVLAAEGLVVSKSRSRRVVSAPAPTVHTENKPPVPQVLLVGGYAGSGKTELGRILARETGWPMLDKDTLTRPVVEAALQIVGQSPNDRESKTYLEMIRPREYESLAAAMMENVECGNSAIVTAPFLREFADEAWLGRTQADLRDLGAVMTVVWVYCDAESMHRWIRKRSAARDSGKLADWPGYLRMIDTEFRPPVPHRVLNNCVTGEPLQDQARNLLKSVLGG
jgi:DNA-binding transcriptional regulator YhcF (GntR family)/predicted kinase